MPITIAPHCTLISVVLEKGASLVSDRKIKKILNLYGNNHFGHLFLT
jgi:hypothetical protein